MRHDDDDEKFPAAVLCGILNPVFDWTPEQRAATEPEPESNVIYLTKKQSYKPMF